MIKLILFIIILFFVIILFFLLYISLVNKKVVDVSNLEINNNQKNILLSDQDISLTTFNIGYAGLDEAQDFFMDGGKNSRSSSKEQTLKNMNSILEFIQNNETDFFLIQEIDIRSSRSFDLNQYTMLKEVLDKYASVFGWNYNAVWVPVPVLTPMGYVDSGMATFSNYEIQSAVRYQLPGKESWPVQLFELDRSIIESRIPIDNNKELIIVNLHLSAYDKGGKIRKVQLEFLKKYIKETYKENENYLILGGDWNHLLKPEQLDDADALAKWPKWLVTLPEDFTPEGFQWAVDKSVWTVRDNKTAYIEGESFVSVIDGFLLSPNIEIIEVYGHDFKFKDSDHNPVSAKIRLK